MKEEPYYEYVKNRYNQLKVTGDKQVDGLRIDKYLETAEATHKDFLEYASTILEVPVPFDPEQVYDDANNLLYDYDKANRHLQGYGDAVEAIHKRLTGVVAKTKRQTRHQYTKVKTWIARQGACAGLAAAISKAVGPKKNDLKSSAVGVYETELDSVRDETWLLPRSILKCDDDSTVDHSSPWHVEVSNFVAFHGPDLHRLVNDAVKDLRSSDGGTGLQQLSRGVLFDVECKDAPFGEIGVSCTDGNEGFFQIEPPGIKPFLFIQACFQIVQQPQNYAAVGVAHFAVCVSGIMSITAVSIREIVAHKCSSVSEFTKLPKANAILKKSTSVVLQQGDAMWIPFGFWPVFVGLAADTEFRATEADGSKKFDYCAAVIIPVPQKRRDQRFESKQVRALVSSHVGQTIAYLPDQESEPAQAWKSYRDFILK